MSYFVTGATGFIGRYLVSNLLKRKGTVHVLVRKGSEKKLEAIAASMGWDRKRIVPVTGDLSKPRLGLTAAQVKALTGKIQHFFHLAAIYDMSARRRLAAGGQHRRHPPRHRTGGGHQGRLLPPHQFDRRRRPVPGRVPRGHVRGGRRPARIRTCAPSTSPKASCARSARCRSASTARPWSSAIPRPARWTRSTARTTCSA